ncbi:MAG: hypothetical protein AABX93_00675 [Nanoarchaeota archaeon]
MKNARLIVFLALAVLVSSGFVESEDVFSDSKKDIIVIRILDFESPTKLGDFFNFQYYLRDVSGIDDAVVVDFWMEKDGREIAYGSDNFFLDTSNRSIQSKIFLPSNLQSGIYSFNIRASHDEFSSASYRTIEIVVKDGFAVINGDNKSMNIIIVSLILLVIFNIGLIYHVEKDKIGRIFNFREAFASEKDFLAKHRFTLLVSSFFVISWVLIYYLDYAEILPKNFAYVGYAVLGVLAVLILARTISEKFFSESKSSKAISGKAIEKKSGRLKKINDWLQGDVKFNSRTDGAALKEGENLVKQKSSKTKNSLKIKSDKLNKFR